MQRDVDAAVAKVKSAAQAELASVERDLEESSGRAAAMKGGTYRYGCGGVERGMRVKGAVLQMVFM